ncbi:Spermatoproteinsis associated protein 5, partial [Mortierella sp. AD031]
MDLTLVRQESPSQDDKGGVRQAVHGGCWVHPITLTELRVPALGLVSVQHPLLFDGATTYQQCLPHESIPQGAIRLSRWTIGHIPQDLERVRVEGVHVDEPLAKVARLVVTPVTLETDTVDTLSGWIKPTNASNTELISQGKRSGQWMSKLLEQGLRNQVISAGSIFPARIKGQQRFFRIKEVQFTQEEEDIHASRGVMMKESTVEIAQESATTSESFSRVDAYKKLGIPNKKAVVVSGVAGSGKKTVIRACCRKMKLREFPLSLARALSDTEIMESDQAAALSHVRTVFDMALQSAPNRGIDSQLQSSAVSILTKEIERARLGKDVFVFAVTRNRSKLPEVFTKQELFQHEFQIPIPVKAQRQHILESLIDSVEGKNTETPNTSELAQRGAQMSSGYVAKDLRNLYRSALLHSLRDTKTGTGSERVNTSGSAEWKDFAYAVETSKPSQQIEFESFSSQRAQGVFGGYRDLKRRVHQAINWPVTNPETFKRIGVRPPMGLLLYGPSGCGKTMLVQTLASESNMNFIPIKGPEIFSKYLGETEATLRRLFAMARQIAPCILFFDEMDSIGARRGWGGDGDSAGTNGVNERVLSTLLNEMDGVEERTGDQETRRTLAKKTVGFSPADLDALF